MKPSKTLYNLVATLDGDFNADVRRWLQTGLRRFADGETLPRALGLDCVHSRGAAYALRRHKMLAHLRRAAELIPAADTWTKAKALSSEVKAFSRRWPKLKASPLPPEGLSDLQAQLFHAFQADGGNLPKSDTRLYEILAGDAPPR